MPAARATATLTSVTLSSLADGGRDHSGLDHDRLGDNPQAEDRVADHERDHRQAGEGRARWAVAQREAVCQHDAGNVPADDGGDADVPDQADGNPVELG